ncbi:MAG: thiamine-phosphate kinase [Thermoplasmata archaeon]|uniref:Thiamine-monophosphate kinase n=1 Tax=Candidatus Sysuiplasma superficiale TaxID=2823368 RepID=A0A8J7YT63_9ARCH|nr:thiamine-phosphate kinase [Candidatus Sysuiplasma superficiale]MBX8644126.1 thiamine-phosphate kinase [Candidatus Sysuiplasma superficiale]MCL4346473.1 thiamine-phosphate kinase [Candidatus Thermoplasmatota archaeon]
MIGERDVIERIGRIFRSPDPPMGIGDDCSVINIGGREMLVTSDMLSETTHLKYCGSYLLRGSMAMTVNLSDIAAKGGVPEYAFVTLGLPKTMRQRDVDSIAKGIKRTADSYGVRILGGDTKRARELMISITLIGEAHGKPLLRSSARPGDLLAVTGTIGKAAYSYSRVSGHGRGGMICTPVARVKEGLILSESGVVGASIDITDGLAISAHFLSRASGVRIVIEQDKIPVYRPGRLSGRRRKWDEFVLYWGGDYELLFTIRGEDGLAKLERMGKIDFHVIGQVSEGRGVYANYDGEIRSVEAKGYDSIRGGVF